MNIDVSNLDSDDLSLVVLSSSSASLDASPKKNWVENAGGLPPYVRKLARGIMKSGKSKSQAIAIAISRIKKWAAGGDDVEADTRAKAAKALAQWEKAKAKNKAGQVIKATNPDGGEYLALSVGSFDVRRVEQAWSAVQDRARQRWYDAHREEILEFEKAHDHGMADRPVPPFPYPGYAYLRALYTDFIVVGREDNGQVLVKIPYTVTDAAVTFGTAAVVKIGYEPVEGWDGDWDGLDFLFEPEDDGDLSENEILLLGLKG